MKEFSCVFNESVSRDFQCEKMGVCTQEGHQLFSAFSEQFAMVFVRKGWFGILADNAKFDLKAGDLLFSQPFTAFRMSGCSAEYEYRYLLFGGIVAQKYFRTGEKIQVRRCGDALAKRFDQLFSAREGGLRGELEAVSLLSSGLAEMSERSDRATFGYGGTIDEFIRYVNENFMTTFSVSELCRKMGVSVNYFTNYFSKRVNKSPKQYVIDLRVSKAKNMLETSNLAVNEIARYVGYEEPLYFSREFKKKTGVSPNEYRKLAKNTLIDLKEYV